MIHSARCEWARMASKGSGWIFHTNGQASPEQIQFDVEPVDYFAWNTKNDILAFVLGEPITLVKGNANEVDDFIITSNVGGTPKVIPETNDFAFERTEEDGSINIYSLFDDTDEFKKVITKPEGILDWCVSMEGSFITAGLLVILCSSDMLILLFFPLVQKARYQYLGRFVLPGVTTANKGRR